MLASSAASPSAAPALATQATDAAARPAAAGGPFSALMQALAAAVSETGRAATGAAGRDPASMAAAMDGGGHQLLAATLGSADPAPLKGADESDAAAAGSTADATANTALPVMSAAAPALPGLPRGRAAGRAGLNEGDASQRKGTQGPSLAPFPAQSASADLDAVTADPGTTDIPTVRPVSSGPRKGAPRADDPTALPESVGAGACDPSLLPVPLPTTASTPLPPRGQTLERGLGAVDGLGAAHRPGDTPPPALDAAASEAATGDGAPGADTDAARPREPDNTSPAPPAAPPPAGAARSAPPTPHRGSDTEPAPHRPAADDSAPLHVTGPRAPEAAADPANAVVVQSVPPAPASVRPESPAGPAPNPAEQVAPALIALTRGPDGAHHLTIRLHPEELGQVDVRIDRSTDGPTRVEITVERPETLRLMLHDQSRLERALDQAGIPAEGRSLVLHVAAPEAARNDGTGGGGQDQAPGQGTAGWWTQAGGGGSNLAGGQPHTQGGRDGPASGQGSAQEGQGAGPDLNADAAPQPRRTGWLRAGLDITA